MDFKISPEQTPVARNPINGHVENIMQSHRGHNDNRETIEGPLSPKSSGQQSYMIELQELEAEATVWSPSKDEGNGVLPQLPPPPVEVPPKLPPRKPLEEDDIPPPKPPRPQAAEVSLSGQPAPSGSEMERQQARVKQQRSETYQIRLVNWFDASSPRNPRRSPIMVQNKNGPCPLLALVNALVLSTPATLTTALVETLRVREQVSLGLLLDAVIDELMSGRRGDAAQALPDISELYAFLINLHTGMNVNPVFVEPIRPLTNLIDEPISGQPRLSQEARRPGGFEETSAMRLYSTFAIALIHGWLPRRNHPVCAALERSAKTYEDAQSLMFAEEELESKIRDQGLNNDEQRLLEDIASVKYFLASSPTQLTEYGLDSITETLVPGGVAILFRNDHFSTLYKQPRSGRIFTLVTDMGYAGHDEVVWESLVDVSGEGSEFFSGDFLPVGNNVSSNNRQSSPGDTSGWTTVSRSGGNARTANPSSSQMPTGTSNKSVATATAFSQLSLNKPDEATGSSNIEQEDHDLALAMQLQEEEEDRERQEAASRLREDELSRAYLDSQGPLNRKDHGRGFDVRPQVPPRGGGSRQAPQRKQIDSEDSPPPSYEQAAKGPAYIPPLNTAYQGGLPSATNVSASGSPAVRPERQSSAYSQTSASYAALAGSPTSPSNSSRQGRRRNSLARGPVAYRGVHPVAMQGAPSAAFRRQQAEDDDRKDCILM